MQFKPIERIDKPSVEQFQNEFVIPDKPVVISGVANDWPACSLWKPDTLKSMFGDVRVPVRQSDNELDVFFGKSTAVTEISSDILFIPAFWWHQALFLTTTININMWVYTNKICKVWEQHPAFTRNFTKA